MHFEVIRTNQIVLSAVEDLGRKKTAYLHVARCAERIGYCLKKSYISLQTWCHQGLQLLEEGILGELDGSILYLHVAGGLPSQLWMVA